MWICASVSEWVNVCGGGPWTLVLLQTKSLKEQKEKKKKKKTKDRKKKIVNGDENDTFKELWKFELQILWWVFLFVVVVVAKWALSISVHIPHISTFSRQRLTCNKIPIIDLNLVLL